MFVLCGMVVVVGSLVCVLVCLRACLFVSLFVRLCACVFCLFVCWFVCLVVGSSVCLFGWLIVDVIASRLFLVWLIV